MLILDAQLEAPPGIAISRRRRSAEAIFHPRLPTAFSPARIASSRRAERTFCDRCDTPLTFQLHASPEELDVTVCSMDHPERIAPEDHTQTLTQLPWIRLADGLPRHETERPPLQA